MPLVLAKKLSVSETKHACKPFSALHIYILGVKREQEQIYYAMQNIRSSTKTDLNLAFIIRLTELRFYKVFLSKLSGNTLNFKNQLGLGNKQRIFTSVRKQ